MTDWENYLLYGLLGVLLIFSLFFFAGAGVSIALEQECQRLGYPSATLTVGWDKYCLARVDQTDYVVPIDTARARPRRGIP
jgi:hypothetical protein